MNKRTLRIINICKCNTRYNVGKSQQEAIISYLSEVHKMPIEFYTETELTRILKEVFYDFLDSCDKPSYYLKEIDRFIIHASYNGAIIDVLALIDVYDTGEDKWINGFDYTFDEIRSEMR